jgi:hypothetical protein
VRGDAGLEKAISTYAGEKGQLAIFTRSANSLRSNQKNCEAQSEAELGEDYQFEVIVGSCRWPKALGFRTR